MDPQPPPWTELRDLLVALDARLGRVESTLADQAHDVSGRQALIDQLHAQLQEARSDLAWKVLRPVLLDLVKLHDGLSAAVANLQDEPAAEMLGDFRQEVEDVLYRQGVSAYSVDGDRFDARRQQAARTREAPSADDVGRVVERLAPGFASDERVLRPERVVVLAAPAKPTSPSA
jgi:molecular chaperone GrpE (heat shock protein)